MTEVDKLALLEANYALFRPVDWWLRQSCVGKLGPVARRLLDDLEVLTDRIMAEGAQPDSWPLAQSLALLHVARTCSQGPGLRIPRPWEEARRLGFETGTNDGFHLYDADPEETVSLVSRWASGGGRSGGDVTSWWEPAIATGPQFVAQQYSDVGVAFLDLINHDVISLDTDLNPSGRRRSDDAKERSKKTRLMR